MAGSGDRDGGFGRPIWRVRETKMAGSGDQDGRFGRSRIKEIEKNLSPAGGMRMKFY